MKFITAILLFFVSRMPEESRKLLTTVVYESVDDGGGPHKPRKTVDQRFNEMLSSRMSAVNPEYVEEESGLLMVQPVIRPRFDNGAVVLSDDGETPETVVSYAPIRLADPVLTVTREDLVSVDKFGHLTEEPGNSGVALDQYTEGLPANQEHNPKYMPIRARGLQWDHGLYHKIFLESGTVRRGWTGIAQVLTTGNWSVDAASIPEHLTEGKTPEEVDALVAAAEEQAAFVRRALFENLNGGFKKFIKECLYSIIGGNASFVEVWNDPTDENWGAIKKLGFRYPSTINKYIYDDRGQTPIAIEYEDVVNGPYVVDINNIFHIANDAFGEDLEGSSLLRPAVMWVEILQLLTQLEAIAAEKYGTPWTYASKIDETLDGMSPDEKERLKSIVDAALAAEDPIIVLPNNTKLEMTSPAGVMPNFSEPKRFCLERISEIFKAEGSLIGLGATGAYAARESAFNEALMFAPYFAEQIADALNGANNTPYTGPVRKMIDVRFGAPVAPGLYPRVTFSVGDQEDPDFLPRLISATTAGLVQVSDDVIRRVHEHLGLPAPVFEQADPDVKESVVDNILSIAASESIVAADIVDVEGSTKFLDSMETKLGAALSRIATEHHKEWASKFERARKANDFNSADIMDEVESERARWVDIYSREIAAVLGLVFVGGAQFVSKELGVNIPVDMGALMNLKIRSIASEAYNRLTGRFLDRFRQFERGEKSVSLPKLAPKTYKAMAGRAVSDAFNQGRDEVVKIVHGFAGIAGVATKDVIAERSSVLDSDTCEVCEKLDGARAVYGTQRYFDLSPPNKCLGEDRCRCIWTFILPDELTGAVNGELP